MPLSPQAPVNTSTLLPTSRLSAVDARLYLCTDARRAQGDFADFCAAAYDGGVDVIQLRDKTIEAKEELALLDKLSQVAQSRNALWAVNDRVDIGALSGAPVVHLGQGDIAHREARRFLPDAILGASTHAESESLAAISDPDVDYFAVGPCYPTPTKPGRPAPGLDLVRFVASQQPTKPWFAIGGIDMSTLDDVLAAGATRVVVVRAICEATDPTKAARDLKARL